MAAVSDVGIKVDSEDEMDLMGDIFYVSVPVFFLFLSLLMNTLAFPC